MSLKLGTLDITPYINVSKKVTTENIKLKELEIEPSLNNKSYLASDYAVDGFSKITVLPVTANIDANIKPENIKAGVSILGVTGIAASSTSNDFGKKIVDGTLTTITPEDLEGVTEIKDYVFYECGNLRDVTIPDSINKIGIGSFLSTDVDSFGVKYNRAWYIKSESNDHFALLGKYLDDLNSGDIHPNTKIIIRMEHCDDNTSLVLPDSVISISGSAFASNDDINDITLSKNILYIGNRAFLYCYNLKSITFTGNSLKDIEDEVFLSCTSLESITIPEGVTSIGESAFYGCTNLKTIILPSTLKELGFSKMSVYNNGKVFYNTPTTSITFRGTMLQWSNQVNKSSNWNSGSSIKSVICSDGTITL